MPCTSSALRLGGTLLRCRMEDHKVRKEKKNKKNGGNGSNTKYGCKNSKPFCRKPPSRHKGTYRRAVALASRREICVQKFGNAYQREWIEKRMTHFKSTFTSGFIKRFGEIKCCSSQTMRAFLSQDSRAFRERLLISSLRRVETMTHFLRMPYASLPWFCVKLDFYMRTIRRNLH